MPYMHSVSGEDVHALCRGYRIDGTACSVSRSLDHYMIKYPQSRFSGVFLTQGSAGTLGSTDYLREKHPLLKVCAGEALQCPTLLYNGYGSHRIEGIGDKHVPWIHNIKNMDVVAGIDDEPNIQIMRLFNEPDGKAWLINDLNLDEAFVNKLECLGISSIANLMGTIKLAKYFEMDGDDVLFTVATDSMDMYQSRLKEQKDYKGDLTANQAEIIFGRDLQGIKTDNLIEMTYYEKRRMHNLKYFTWIEQQGKTLVELNAQWYDSSYWKSQYAKVDEWDEKIMEFNEQTGLLKEYE